MLEIAKQQRLLKARVGIISGALFMWVAICVNISRLQEIRGQEFQCDGRACRVSLFKEILYDSEAPIACAVFPLLGTFQFSQIAVYLEP